jgi:hypothetical protein
VEIKQHSPFRDKLKIRRRAFLPCLKARGFQPEDFDELQEETLAMLLGDDVESE